MQVDQPKKLTVTLEGDEVNKFRELISKLSAEASKTGFNNIIPIESFPLLKELEKKLKDLL